MPGVRISAQSAERCDIDRWRDTACPGRHARPHSGDEESYDPYRTRRSLIMGKPKKKKRQKTFPKARRFSRRAGIAVALLLIAWAIAGDWFVHHPRKWIEEKRRELPDFAVDALLYAGNPVGDLTDAFGITGHDVVYEYDEEAPEGKILFAGAPLRINNRAPADIKILDRGEFLVGWSPSLRRPVWSAYHVRRESRFPDGSRPKFQRDRNAENCPEANAYKGSGYDRGHMTPNHAIISRYGEEARRLTFLMSNIAPQTPALNRGPWRDLEHRIAELWTARYGEIWVIVGAITTSPATRLPSNVEVPESYYQIVVAQEGMSVRALAVIIPQNVAWDAYPARYLTTIDEVEELTGLNFLPDLPDFIQSPLEAELPTRLWPTRAIDAFSVYLCRANPL